MKIFNKFLKHNKLTRSFCVKKDLVKDEKYYEQEWNNIYIKKFNEKKKFLEDQLSSSEKKEVELLVEAMNILNPDEKNLFLLLVKKNIEKISGVNALNLDISTPSSMINNENLWPKENPEWYNTSHLTSTLSAFKGIKMASINN